MLAAQDFLVKSNHLSFSIHTFIITFIQYNHPSPFAVLRPLTIFLNCSNLPWVPSQVEVRPTLQKARELQTELSCTLLHGSYTAP